MQASLVDRKIDAICAIVELYIVVFQCINPWDVHFINTYPNIYVKCLLGFLYILLFLTCVHQIVSRFLKNLYIILFVWED